MRARLIPLDGSDPIEISRDLTVVGRKEDCDLRLDHKSVSKMHCVLVKTDGLLLVRDLGSTNGTRVNGQRIRRAALLPNDQISIAGFKFRIYLGPDAEPVAEDNGATLRMENEQLKGVLKVAQARKDAIHREANQILQRNQLPDVYSDEHSHDSIE
jgi:pSer/pThr/pTyr-binding forkhead associated (FHA) protein